MDIVTLITRLKKGDELAFRELVYSFSSRLMTIARIYARSEDDAKDTLQDAFVVVFRKIRGFEGDQEAAFYGWLKRIIINISLSKNQRKYRNLESSLNALDIERGFDEQIISNLSHQEIMDLIFNLPDDYRQVFALFAIEGFSHREIAAMLNISETNSRTHLYRSKKLLQEKIGFSQKIVIA